MPIHPTAHPSVTLPSALADAPRHDSENDATLRLLRGCVEAMSLLQAKVEGFDQLVDAVREDGKRDLAQLRVEFAGLLGTQSRDGARLADAEVQLGKMQASASEVAKRLGDDIAGARAEAAHWRMRVETDAMAFDQLSNRLAALEEGFGAKLQAAEQRLQEREQVLAERTEENGRLRSETRVVEAATDRMRGQLTSLEATIADQRARISCLQNKLATATYAMRLDHMSRDAAGLNATPGPDILDLAPPPVGRSRVSAA